jgi:glycosyltransferase involved in cell wall biosynthesis
MIEKPFVSIVVPTKNNAKTIYRCLKSLKGLKYPKYEIIVVDGCSGDGTNNIALEQGCKVYSEMIGTRAGALKIGFKHAAGEIVVFTDADCTVEPDWLNELVKHYDGESVAGVGGVNNIVLTDVYSRFLSSIKFSGVRWAFRNPTVIYVNHNVGCNSSYRKKCLSEIGGFDKSLITAEDVDLDYRLRQRGYKLVFTPHAKIKHYKHFSLKKFIRWLYRFGFGKGQILRKYTKPIFPLSHFLLAIILPPYGFGMIMGLIVKNNLSKNSKHQKF